MAEFTDDPISMLLHINAIMSGERAIRPRVVCADGFSLSVQASGGHYCSPREDRGPWWRVEVGYPSERVEALMPYAEDPAEPTETVYGYVPVEIVDAVIAAHGGIAA